MRGSYVLTFDCGQSVDYDNISVYVDISSFKSIRQCMEKLVNANYESADYFKKHNYKIPKLIDFSELHCYKSDLTEFIYFKIIEIIL